MARYGNDEDSSSNSSDDDKLNECEIYIYSDCEHLFMNADEGKKISEESKLAAIQLRDIKKSSLVYFPEGMGYMRKTDLTIAEFKKCLNVYERNQIVLKNDPLELNKLENWFIQIIEPVPAYGATINTRPLEAELAAQRTRSLTRIEKEEINDEIKLWYERECYKVNGTTSYCNTDLAITISISANVKRWIGSHLTRLKEEWETKRYLLK